MKRLFLSLFILVFSLLSFNPSQSQHLNFLKKQDKSAKEYVIDLFKTKDIVILCERHHSEFTQYELFLEIAKDPYFIENVGHIFTEVGVANMDEEINKFLQSEQQDSLLTRNIVTSIFREIDYTPYWHCYSFPWFIGELFDLNQNLSADKKLMLHPSHYEFSWASCKTSKDYKEFDSRINNPDSTMAQNIIKRFNLIQSGNAKRKKALVIMNYKHAFLKDHRVSGEITHNTGRYLSSQYPGKVASVYIMGLAIPKENNYTLIKNGRWDYYFERSKKTDVGFSLTGSPFGPEEFDAIPPDPIQHFKYEDMFTGLVFYRSVQDHVLRTGWDGYVSDAFEPELRRRIELFNEAKDLGMSKEEIEKKLMENNIERVTPYSNIQKLRAKIDQWHSEVH